MQIKTGHVAELNGLDSPFVFSELLLQRIWQRGRFERSRARTLEGVSVEVLHPGRWNRLAGPDFKGARLRIGGKCFEGDVELHLQAADWVAHAHAHDPAYDGVVLHVVLFGPKSGLTTPGAKGAIPTMELISLLPTDLETFALDEAAERLAGRSLLEAHELLALKTREERSDLLWTHAMKRWESKLSHARLRLSRLGWEGACHHAALECLGFRFNRAVMLDVAMRHPLEQWRGGGLEVDRIWQAFDGSWRSSGVRPANHPKRRLQQYLSWVQARPNWPQVLSGLRPDRELDEANGLPRPGTGLRRRWQAALCGGSLEGPRFDTFVCDACLPLLVAATEPFHNAASKLWFVWWPGDMPAADMAVLRQLRIVEPGMQVMCNGWRQGLLGWCLDREYRLNTSEMDRRAGGLDIAEAH